MIDLYDRVFEELDDEYGHGPTELAANLGVTKKEVRAVLQSMVREGFAFYSCLFDIENTGTQLCGWGYSLTPTGRRKKDGRQ